MKNVFSTYHPAINFCFFVAVLSVTIFLKHPVFVLITVTAAFVYAILLEKKATIRFSVPILFMIVLFTIINPLVNARGKTILFYTKYSRVTLEAAIYGCISGFGMAAVLLWFYCYNKTMTSDKFLFLFCKIMPSTAMIFSMVMRFVPNFYKQIHKISYAQKCIGQDISDGSKIEKIKHGMKILSILFTWALENSIDSADSMRARGYGSKQRSTFSIYRFDTRDVFAAVFLVVLIIVVWIKILLGKCSIVFYPTIVMHELDMVLCIAYSCFCYFPVMLELKERIAWKFLQSKI